MQAICFLILRHGGRGAGDGFVTGSAGLSGNALNDEPRVKKEKRGRGVGVGVRDEEEKAADAELIVREDPWGFLLRRGQESFPLPPVTDFYICF